jgi:MFS family permease
MGFVADRLNRKMMVVAGGLLISYAIFSFEWADSFKDLVLANVLFGVGGGIAMPALMALAVLKGNSSSAMGSVMGLLSMSHSLGMLAGSLFAGLMMDIFQLRHAFPSGAVIMLLSVAIFFVCTYYKEGVPARSDLTTGTIDL